MTLEPGDIVSTGTPAGVGGARDPRVWLKPGDEVVVSSPPARRAARPGSASASVQTRVWTDPYRRPFALRPAIARCAANAATSANGRNQTT